MSDFAVVWVAAVIGLVVGVVAVVGIKRGHSVRVRVDRTGVELESRPDNRERGDRPE